MVRGALKKSGPAHIPSTSRRPIRTCIRLVSAGTHDPQGTTLGFALTTNGPVRRNAAATGNGISRSTRLRLKPKPQPHGDRSAGRLQSVDRVGQEIAGRVDRAAQLVLDGHNAYVCNVARRRPPGSRRTSVRLVLPLSPPVADPHVSDVS
jgi:hypothetical protein